MLPHVQCADRFAGRPNLVPSCPATHHAGFRSPGLRLHILRNDPFVGAGMRMGKAHSPNILLNLLRASAARTRDSFPFTRKGIKGVPKRRYPLWKHLWRGTSPRELRFAKFSPPVCSTSKQMSGIAPTTSGNKWLRRYSSFLGSVGFQKGLAPFAGDQGTRRFLVCSL